jgi:hypothetical protein
MLSNNESNSILCSFWEPESAKVVRQSSKPFNLEVYTTVGFPQSETWKGCSCERNNYFKIKYNIRMAMHITGE